MGLVLAIGLTLFTACGVETPASSPSSPPPPGTTTVFTTLPRPSSTTSAPPSSAPSSSSRQPKTGKVVVLDPGHNGGNAGKPGEINKQVPAGRGKTKPCNTTGTSTNSGYTEHAFTWDVSQRISQALAAKGIRVVLTRQSDTGVGPCVNERAAIGNDAGADAVVSIHADGSNSAGAHGFHVAYSAPPLNAQQGEPSMRLATALRDGLRAGGFPISTYLGSNGLAPRADLGGLNLSTRPAALVECGNMRNAAEAAAMASEEGRQQYAAVIAKAIEDYLAG
ncbi:N-acetylmuramoyl-L-alanine amidase [Amycolatopsis keratiniphila]|uniref:N-acetylmuramoyl-L-alanine amidase n=1 Tax=Amycolatopsis keratiniphila subsp. keratiniphila TaxID=227715 RepID=A0A1W2M4R3_9PSEU|nr:N-acetylmuramoyl-L-alanine amidase [Amycolatopsis keratiniphila]OLZ60307.1 N-acetylmuramoyl-L-alanine amidase [Amycolatopsis keratiniphila subsp. nogabecina]ONF74877.1 N-acetylmuramoyl-L-alanine amidase [Amycolatopsis keratiniphila subsp. keratiniphila]SDU58784.1 N-acetylmuramoyl-L-alanine amidase [Amycolatopsis keratiniphila]